MARTFWGCVSLFWPSFGQAWMPWPFCSRRWQWLAVGSSPRGHPCRCAARLFCIRASSPSRLSAPWSVAWPWLISICRSFPCRDGLDAVNLRHQHGEIGCDLAQVDFGDHAKAQGLSILGEKPCEAREVIRLLQVLHLFDHATYPLFAGLICPLYDVGQQARRLAFERAQDCGPLRGWGRWWCGW